MKRAGFTAAIIVALAARGILSQAPRVPVLVELYTSEGCSSCPPADALLEALQREQPVEGAEVIPVGLHVDYFNNLGWKDTFSSSSFTARQQAYSPVFGGDNLYTPQMVVDGHEAVAGNEDHLVRRAIEVAARRPHLPLRLSTTASADRVRLTIDLPAVPQPSEKIELVAAITEDALTTNVQSGENKGRTLHHVAVARKVQVLDSLSPKSSVVEKQLPIGQTWGPNHLKVLVWLQGVKSRQVYGAATARIAR
jgi:hypothetical protein